MPATSGFFTPQSNLIGLTPQQLRYGAPGLDPSQQYGGIPGELASALGIGENTALENKAYSIVAGGGQPSEYIQSRFGATSPYKGAEDALAASKPITELKPNDEVLVHLAAKGGRHFGISVPEETVIEK